MALNEDQIREALTRVIDPELKQDLVTLDMIKSIAIDGGDVTVGVTLTIPGCPLKATINDDVTREVGSVPGVERVAIEFGSMSEDQRAALATKLRGGRPPKAAGELSVSPKTRVIAVASGKGGVGKSSLTVNLAIAFQQMGLEVGVIDADIYGFSIPGMLGIHQRPVTVDKMIVPPVAHGLKTISIGYFMEEGGAVLWRGPMLHKAMQQFLSDVHWGELDVLLIDMPPGTGDVAISLGGLVPNAEAVVITTPQAAAQRVAERAAAVSERVNMRVVGVIENMSYRVCPCCGERDDLFGSGGGASLAGHLDVPLLAEIPLEPALREGGDIGVPFTISAPDSPAAVAIRALAERLHGMRTQDPLARIKKPLKIV
ncbi:MAG: Mrp/NBP35 family ATP-binding protein [Actinobacteria bacterium]|nr:Mrp/NBP35 family ATP-binding protein [Actinomycetota bacterium]